MDKKIMEHIDCIANELNPISNKYLLEVSNCITELNNFIDGTVELSDEDIDTKLKILERCMIDINLRQNVTMIRARKWDVGYKIKDNVKDLSYPPFGISLKTGRCNLKDESVFYTCIYTNDIEEAKRVAYSEVKDIKKGEKIYLLISRTKDKIILKYIGILNHFYRNAKPYFLNDEVWKKLKLYYAYMKNEFNDELFIANYLCDTFFADIMRRKSSPKLYKVTSKITSRYIKAGIIDGILYTSVKVEGEPVIILNISTVDEKIKHTRAEVYELIEDYGYAVYSTKKLHSGTIEKSGKINWIAEDE